MGFYGSNDPTNSVKALREDVQELGFNPTRSTPLSQKCCRGTVQTTSHVCSHSNSYNLRSHVRSTLKDALKSSVFICRLNVMYDSVVPTDAGTAFQACAMATGNTLSPSVVRRMVGTSNEKLKMPIGSLYMKLLTDKRTVLQDFLNGGNNKSSPTGQAVVKL